MLSKAASSNIFKVFGMTRPGIEPRSPGPLANTLLIRPISRPARTYIQQLYADTRCNPEDLPGAMNDREGWRERVMDIRRDDDDI